jgi:hypothetical protein
MACHACNQPVWSACSCSLLHEAHLAMCKKVSAKFEGRERQGRVCLRRDRCRHTPAFVQGALTALCTQTTIEIVAELAFLLHWQMACRNWVWGSVNT